VAGSQRQHGAGEHPGEGAQGGHRERTGGDRLDRLRVACWHLYAKHRRLTARARHASIASSMKAVYLITFSFI
jgi:hypothetical protein